MSYIQHDIIIDLLALGIVLFVVHMILSMMELYNIRRAIRDLARHIEKQEEKPRTQER